VRSSLSGGLHGLFGAVFFRELAQVMIGFGGGEQAVAAQLSGDFGT